MKFGEYLLSEQNPEWAEAYLDYKRLKNLIKTLHDRSTLSEESWDGSRTGASLSVPPPTNAAAQIQSAGGDGASHESFYQVLESEMKKIETFTKETMKRIRGALTDIESDVSERTEAQERGEELSETQRKSLKEATKAVGKEYLKLEKFVNLNFTGFHKILKKHDRWLPNPCKAFYLTRLHSQSWVRGDQSDVIVLMSSIYSSLRGDHKVAEKEEDAQNFTRSTRKYWVHTEDVSKVKYQILQHLPVFLQKDEQGEVLGVDSQLVNSVYTDNYSMELYHGRLDKTPGAIALRFRWYGTGQPRTVFVERKTHRESWTGDISVKERFMVSEDQVLPLLKGTYDVNAQAEMMRAKGKSEAQVKEWLQLAGEIAQVIISKQLKPVMRTQYMRTAFQIPFDPSVRISLDSNLTMVLDRTKETANGDAWYRDPTKPVPLTEITRFPHAILEVKLQLEGDARTPDWVQGLLDSGMIMEVHKFSKFIHGCAVLLPEEIHAVPYWIDDASIKLSIEKSGASRILEVAYGANEVYNHLLPHDSEGNSKVALAMRDKMEKGARLVPMRDHGKPGSFMMPNVRAGAAGLLGERETVKPGVSYEFQEGYLQDECMTCDWAQQEDDPKHIVQQKVEPKLHFANERTFIKWLHMATVLCSISIGVMAFTDATSDAQQYAVALLPVALAFIAYALVIFLWRSNQIRTRSDLRWDDPMGPVILTSMLILALSTQFILKVYDIYLNGMHFD